MNSEPAVSIIVLNWNGWQDTIECLESLYQLDYQNRDIIVVDNGSKDGSAERIKEYCGGKRPVASSFFQYDANDKPITVREFTRTHLSSLKEFHDTYLAKGPYNRLILIKNEKNYGFSSGNNIAIQFALNFLEPDYVLLLNNDTVVEKRFLTELVTVSESERKIAILGPKTYYYDFHGRNDVINFAGGKFSVWTGITSHIGINEADSGQYDEIRQVNYVEGSCLLVKRETVEDIGLLNPCLFTWDDIEWCLRAHKRGWKCVYVPQAKIWHKIGASLGGEFSYTYLHYFVRSSLLFMKQDAELYHKFTFVPFWFALLAYKISFIVRREKKLGA
ncbi:MAG: glycosyltransferase family 2 protein, partial [Halobacteriota archaeon]